MSETSGGHGPYRYTNERDSLVARMRRIEGQARGVAGMIEEGRYCLDIVQQLASLSSAAEEVALLVLQDHIEGCVAEAIKQQRGDKAIKELMSVLRKAIKR